MSAFEPGPASGPGLGSAAAKRLLQELQLYAAAKKDGGDGLGDSGRLKQKGKQKGREKWKQSVKGKEKEKQRRGSSSTIRPRGREIDGDNIVQRDAEDRLRSQSHDTPGESATKQPNTTTLDDDDNTANNDNHDDADKQPHNRSEDDEETKQSHNPPSEPEFEEEEEDAEEDKDNEEDDMIEYLSPISDAELDHWTAILRGPRGTAYEGGRWKLDVRIPHNYPLAPPDVRFVTRVCHPNVHLETGEICLDLLNKAWSAAYTIAQTLTAVHQLLSDAAPDSPLNVDVAALLRSGDRVGAESLVRFYVREFRCED